MAQKKKRIKPIISMTLSKDTIACLRHNPAGTSASQYAEKVLARHFKYLKKKGVKFGAR